MRENKRRKARPSSVLDRKRRHYRAKRYSRKEEEEIIGKLFDQVAKSKKK